MKKIYLILGLIVAGTFFSCSNDGDDPVVKSSLASISEFSIDFQGVKKGGVITEGLGTENITVSVPFGTNLTAKTNIKVSKGATVEPKSGTEVTFEDGKAKDFVVTAEDGTKKTYKVNVKVRPEVGSGTKLKKFTEENGLYGKTTTYEFSYNDSNLVSNYTETEGSKSKKYILKYNSKNQITEKENTTDKIVVSYVYDDKGLIVSAEEKKEGELLFSYVYEYNSDGDLSKLTRKQEGEDDYIQTFEYEEGNVVKHKIAKDVYSSTFDKKHNPFIGIFPKSYGKILVGNFKVMSVNKNNFITKTGADAELVYEYNTDDFPVNYSYTVFGFATIKVTFEYF